MSDKRARKPSAKWIDVSQRSSIFYLPSFVGVILILLCGCLGVSEQQVWCQMQGYTLLALATLALFLYIKHKADLLEQTVESMRTLYCVECCKESRGSLMVGRLTATIGSNYERLFAAPPRFYLAIIIWLAWIVYGSVFHEGQHALAEEAFLDALVESRAFHVHFLRTVRILVLFAISAALCFLPPAKSLIMYSSVVFFLLLFFPDEDSSAQTLSLWQIMAKTSLFFCLFFCAELAERARQYRLWIESYSVVYETHLACVLMAMGIAKPMRLTDDSTSDDVIIPIADPSINGTRFSLVGMLSRWSILLKSSWILLAGDAFLMFGALQITLLLVQLLLERRRAFASVAVNSTTVRRKALKSPRNVLKNAESGDIPKENVVVPPVASAPISLKVAHNTPIHVYEKVAQEIPKLVAQLAPQSPVQARSRQMNTYSLQI
jgi:hypothetical protein